MVPRGHLASSMLKQDGDRVVGIAPIAAHFENCLQRFEQLCATLESRQLGGNSMYSAVDGCLSEFRRWGDDTGAAEGLLDHSLRKSSRLQQATKDLLTDLLSTLQTSKILIFEVGAH